jgi:PadR family transcriptional regulator, regulatory protein AphA
VSLAHAILGLLAREPMTGYDLKTRWFDRALRYFWPADQAQIYRTLDRLEAQGWATVRVEPGHDRPNRKVYSPTAAGRAELVRWLAAPQPLPTVRDPLLVQLFCGAAVPDETLTRLLAQQAEAHRQRLAEYERLLASFQPDWGTPRQLRLWRLTLENGIRRERAYLDWLAAASTELSEEFPPEPG